MANKKNVGIGMAVLAAGAGAAAVAVKSQEDRGGHCQKEKSCGG